MYVLRKSIKNIKFFPVIIFNFYNLEKIYILHGRVFVMFWELCLAVCGSNISDSTYIYNRQTGHDYRDLVGQR